MKGIFSGTWWLVVWITIVALTAGIGLLPLAAALFFIFAGASARETKAAATLRSTLMRDEHLVAEGMQHRVFALWSRRALIAITNSRVLIIRRGLLGGFKMQDIQWKDLTDAKIEQNVLSSVCGSNLKFNHSNSTVGMVNVDGVEDAIAAEIYAHSQSQEQAWEEKRRVRTMEEVRAAAGGVVVHTGHSHQALSSDASPPSTGNKMLEQIEKAKNLFDNGAISDSEFQEMKSKILSAT